MNTIYESTGNGYKQQGDYFIPNLATKEQRDVHIGVWANRHRQHLKCAHKVRYYNLLTVEKLYDYLAEIEEQAENYFQNLVKSLAEKEGITEELKAKNQFLWVQKMNGIRNQAMDIVNSEIIFN